MYAQFVQREIKQDSEGSARSPLSLFIINFQASMQHRLSRERRGQTSAQKHRKSVRIFSYLLSNRLRVPLKVDAQRYNTKRNCSRENSWRKREREREWKLFAQMSVRVDFVVSEISLVGTS